MRDKKVFACGEEIRNSKKAEPKEPRMFIGAAANPFADPFDFRAIRRLVEAAGYRGIQEVEIFSEHWWSRPGDEVLKTAIARFDALCRA